MIGRRVIALRRYFNTLAEHSVKVRQLLLSNMDVFLHEGIKALAVHGGKMYMKYTYAASAPGTGNSMIASILKPLRSLVEEGGKSSHLDRSAHWGPNTARTSGVKR